MAVDHHHPRPRRDALDPELLAMVRIIVVVGVLAVLLGVLNHFV
jgi:hypothetical protein